MLPLQPGPQHENDPSDCLVLHEPICWDDKWWAGALCCRPCHGRFQMGRMMGFATHKRGMGTAGKEHRIQCHQLMFALVHPTHNRSTVGTMWAKLCPDKYQASKCVVLQGAGEKLQGIRWLWNKQQQQLVWRVVGNHHLGEKLCSWIVPRWRNELPSTTRTGASESTSCPSTSLLLLHLSSMLVKCKCRKNTFVFCFTNTREWHYVVTNKTWAWNNRDLALTKYTEKQRMSNHVKNRSN